MNTAKACKVCSFQNASDRLPVQKDSVLQVLQVILYLTGILKGQFIDKGNLMVIKGFAWVLEFSQCDEGSYVKLLPEMSRL